MNGGGLGSRWSFWGEEKKISRGDFGYGLLEEVVGEEGWSKERIGGR